MPESDLLSRLEQIGFQITPGALQVLENSHITPKEIIEDIKEHWTPNKARIITVKEAINFMLESSKFAKISQELKKEIKARAKPSELPIKYQKTYNVLKKLNYEVTAGEVARFTHRKRNTETIYLNNLLELGLVSKTTSNDGKSRYKVL